MPRGPRVPPSGLLALALAACGPNKATTAADTTATTSATETTPTEPATAATTGGPGSSTTDTTADPTATGDPTTTADPTAPDPENQTPPQGHDAIEAWLAEGHYKSWHCEPAPHDPLPVSPHGKQLVCANTLLSSHQTLDEYPVGSASVKELRDDSGTLVLGYAVSLHVAPGITGDTWYWYERVPLDSPAPHDAEGVVADGPGSNGPALTICVGCHAATGIDADHPGHDFVYRQVQ